jgi:hypothetical protein
LAGSGIAQAWRTSVGDMPVPRTLVCTEPVRARNSAGSTPIAPSSRSSVLLVGFPCARMPLKIDRLMPASCAQWLSDMPSGFTAISASYIALASVGPL